MKRFVLVALCLGLVAGVACGGDETTTQPRAFEDARESCSDADESLETLNVVAGGLSDRLARGSVAEFRVRVVRSVDEALANELPQASLSRSIPEPPDPTKAPVEGASVGFFLTVDDSLPALWGVGVTDESGMATVRIKVKKSAATGVADATAFATREVTDGPCMHIAEVGSYHEEEMVTIE